MSRPAAGRRGMGVGHMFNRAVIRGQRIIGEGEEVPRFEGERINERLADSWVRGKHQLSPELLALSVKSRREIGTRIEELVVEYGVTEEDERGVGLVNSYLDMCGAVCELYDDVWLRGKEAVLAWHQSLFEEIESYEANLQRCQQSSSEEGWDLAAVAR